MPIEYSASLNRRSLVGYTPGACAGLVGIDQVQGALDKLCNDIAAIAAPPPPPFMAVKEVRARGNRTPLFNNRTIDAQQLSEGIVVIFSEDLGMAVRGFEPLLQFWIDLPYPPEPAARDRWNAHAPVRHTPHTCRRSGA